VDRAELGGGGGAIAAPLLEDAGPNDAQPGGLVGIVGQRGDRARQRLGGGGVVAGAIGQGQELALHHAVARRQREGVDQVGQRARGVVLLGEADVRGLAQERQPGAVVGRVSQPGRNQAEVAGPVAVLAVAGGQGVGGVRGAGPAARGA
jgi:hypothetical protein